MYVCVDIHASVDVTHTTSVAAGKNVRAVLLFLVTHNYAELCVVSSVTY